MAGVITVLYNDVKLKSKHNSKSGNAKPKGDRTKYIRTIQDQYWESKRKHKKPKYMQIEPYPVLKGSGKTKQALKKSIF